MKKITLLFFVLFLFSACATLHEQSVYQSTDEPQKPISHTVYLTGGFGTKEIADDRIARFSEALSKASAKSTLLFLGDNVSAEKDTTSDQALLEKQIGLAQNFKGNTYFLPGDSEWKSRDNDQILNIQKFLKKSTGNKNSFLPKNGAPLYSIAVNDDLEIIFVDSEWYISDWDNVKNINKDEPDIKTRRQFTETLEGMIKDAGFKNIIIAMHHPVFSNGKYGGKYAFKDHFSPAPLIGTAKIIAEKLGGTNGESINAERYRELNSIVASLAKISDHITIVSAHESSLQYLEGGDIHQVISGSFSDREATRLSKGTITAIGGKLNYKGLYSNSENGYATLVYYEDGSASVEFHSFENDKLLYRHLLMKPLPLLVPKEKNPVLPIFPATTQQQIVSQAETEKSGFYKLIWGKHYRDYYSKPVTVKTALLDTLHGGLTILKEGGGHQSNSLRLQDKEGRQYAMRSLKKDALKFMRFQLKGVAFDTDLYEGTAAKGVINDFFTTSHPYIQLAIGDLAEKARVNHSNTRLYYFPKQQEFGGLNDKYGDALFFVEERPSKKQKDFEGYRFTIAAASTPVKDFASTSEVFEKIRTNPKYSIDQRQYIRSRIFDMLIGDWDRHEDQWRWALHETADGGGIYAPIPRDRDGAFTKFDGIGLFAVKLALPNTRFWQTYADDIKDIKWYNFQAQNLDKLIVNRFDENVWREEAQSISRELTAQNIDAAFANLPVEVRDENLETIKSDLKLRLPKLENIAAEYAAFANTKIVVHGTESDDRIVVERQADDHTKIEIFNKKELEKPYYSNSFDSDKTCEILIYGLNGDDEFIVKGDGNHEMTVRLIGGYGTDTYTISNCAKTRVYDYDYEKTIFDEKQPGKKQLSSLYETNNLYYRFFQLNHNVLLPSAGFVTDDGLFLGFRDTYTYNGFNGRPQKQVHRFYADYYFKYQSVAGGYEGFFSNIFPKIDFFAEVYFSGAKFSNNFFGYGNETVNYDDSLTKDYNRARTSQISAKAGLAYKSLRFAAVFENYKVEETEARLFTPENIGADVFENQSYAGAETSFIYKNRDAEDFPTAGLYTELTIGWKTNTNDSDNNFGYAAAKLGFDQKINSSGNLVFQTAFSGKILTGDNFYFYHAATIGGNNGLRGFRNERFAGRSSFFDSSNLKLKVASFRTGFLPLDFGIYGGFDYGRVWAEDDYSNKWHTSQGGGIWLGGLSAASLQAGYFNSAEGNILFVGFNFKY